MEVDRLKSQLNVQRLQANSSALVVSRFKIENKYLLIFTNMVQAPSFSSAITRLIK